MTETELFRAVHEYANAVRSPDGVYIYRYGERQMLMESFGIYVKDLFAQAFDGQPVVGNTIPLSDHQDVSRTQLKVLREVSAERDDWKQRAEQMKSAYDAMCQKESLTRAERDEYKAMYEGLCK